MSPGGGHQCCSACVTAECRRTERHISAVKGFSNETKLKGIVHPKIKIHSPSCHIKSLHVFLQWNSKEKFIRMSMLLFLYIQLILDRMRHSFVQIISNYFYYKSSLNYTNSSLPKYKYIRKWTCDFKQTDLKQNVYLKIGQK